MTGGPTLAMSCAAAIAIGLLIATCTTPARSQDGPMAAALPRATTSTSTGRRPTIPTRHVDHTTLGRKPGWGVRQLRLSPPKSWATIAGTANGNLRVASVSPRGWPELPDTAYELVSPKAADCGLDRRIAPICEYSIDARHPNGDDNSARVT
jgi:hypothetical protein